MELVIAYISLFITIFTGLSFGLSLVGIQIQDTIRKMAIGTGIAFVAISGLGFYFPVHQLSGAAFVLLLIYLVLYMKIPFLQSVIAVLLGWTFDLAIIQLVERNLFGLALYSNDLDMDSFVLIMNEVFIIVTNVLITYIILTVKPTLIPNSIFIEKPLDWERRSYWQRQPYWRHLLISILLLLTVDVFLVFTYFVRNDFPISYRLFTTGWSVFILIVILLFLRSSLFHKIEQEQIFMDKQYQTDMHEFFNYIRSQRHDFSLHLTSVFGLIKSGRYDEASDYIDEVVEQVQEVNELLPVAHPAISALLNTQSDKAKKQNIRIRYTILDDLRDMPASIYDVNKILGNLIQNAMEEVEQLPEEKRLITVDIEREKRQLVFRVGNSSMMDEERMAKIFETGYTTKEGHEGIGLAVLERLVGGYEGVIFPEMTGDFFVIHVRLPLSSRRRR
ncbi:GHKL domain-containing protein [Sporosarcina sp. Sa2YVA2]|uniref:GHKL domain-containing protein n=1 Tax=Sporosarcina quadrami TaxID=2762234 RepID=A0ABR8UB35_9BACL|nr:GHKL domain-containing protein [Sporosarcina quadrami]MBD7985005.1 GHKL domain-containing protein [Sporosarcina quadrami]